MVVDIQRSILLSVFVKFTQTAIEFQWRDS